MARKVKTCEGDGVCGAQHPTGTCGVPHGAHIARSRKAPSLWINVDAMGHDRLGELTERVGGDYLPAAVVTGRITPVGVRGARVLMCTFCRHAWRARRAAEREEQRLARANRKPLYRRGVLR